jgi:hypothetical protein
VIQIFLLPLLMIAQNLLAKLDPAAIPNLKNIGNQYLNQQYDPGNQYSVPYMGGVATLCINTDKVKEDITSFAQVFDPKYANSIVALPTTIALMFPPKAGSLWDKITKAFGYHSPLYMILFFLLIIAFSYFYLTISFNPIEVANNMKKQGGFIPGIRPGKPTTEYLNKVLNNIIFIGAVGLTIVSVIPIFFSGAFGTNLSFGGTSIIIIVGVIIETIKQIESQLLVRHYKGFLND